LGEEKASVLEALEGLALEGRGSEILQTLMEQAVEVNEVDKRKKISEAMIYVRRNLDWIGNIPKVRGFGAGPVEKTVDIPVTPRFKKRGMSWYRGNANPLFKLRPLKLN